MEKILSLKYEFIKHFTEISNNNLIYSRCIKYDLFQEKELDKEKFSEWQEEIHFLYTMAKYGLPKTRKRLLVELSEELIRSYINCNELSFSKNAEADTLFKKEVDKLKKGKISSNKIIIAAQKIQNKLKKDKDLLKRILNNKEINLVYRKIERILKIKSEYRDEKLSASKISAPLQRLRSSLEKFNDFLINTLQLLIEHIDQDEFIYNEMQKYQIPNLLENNLINPFFMFLVYDSLDQRTHYRIDQKQEHNLFWISFKDNLIVFDDIQKNKKREELPKNDYQYSKKITPKVFFKILDQIAEGKSPSGAIKETGEGGPTESYMRLWIKRNSHFYPKFNGKTYSTILKIATKDDIIKWFRLLGELDQRFRKQIDL
jgi:hypothetical protein